MAMAVSCCCCCPPPPNTRLIVSFTLLIHLIRVRVPCTVYGKHPSALHSWSVCNQVGGLLVNPAVTQVIHLYQHSTL